MINSYNYSRAAILCFGGWGLQLLFHLLPRLQAAQEQRAALGAVAADLSKITSFAAILAEPLLDEQGRTQFYVHQPLLDQPLPPFYIERTLARLERESLRSFDEQTAGILTASETRAMLLLAATQSILQPLTFGGQGFLAERQGGKGQGTNHANEKTLDLQSAIPRATRLDLFRTGLVHAESMARLLETHLLDPIRQDTLMEDDPFVQTTLYVVAPFFEPLTAALVWPLTAQLMARVGRQHISQVIGLFATGSYATDLTRPVENAAAFAALAELEILTGVRRDTNTHHALRTTIDQTAPSLGASFGQPLFDFIYLLDREKSNQGLAQNSHELAVVAANTLEALSVAGGNLFIQEQLGLSLQTIDGRPYSLIGAACDYVPLAQIFHAVNRQEESRLVREWVLRNTEEEPKTAITTPFAAPSGLLPLLRGGNRQAEVNISAMERAAVAQAALRLPGALQEETPLTVDELDIRQSFVLPPPIALYLRRTPAAGWDDAFQAHVDELTAYIRLAVGKEAIDEALGTGAVSPNRDWFMHSADNRLLPNLVTHMQERLLDDLATSPTGLTRAQKGVRRWLFELDGVRHHLRTAATPNARQLARVQRELALRNWEAKYEQAVANAPSAWVVALRSVLALALVALLSFGYLALVQRPWDMVEDGLSLLGFAVGISTVGALAYRQGHLRIRQLRHERVELAQAELRALVQEQVADGLVAAYDRLRDLLNHWAGMLAEAASELSALSTAPTLPAVPPPGVPLITLYQPHLNPALWDRCLEFLRRQQDAQGQLSEERLDKIWGTPAWRAEMRQILSSSAPQAGQTQARTIAQFIRDTVRRSVAPVSIEQPNEVRSELIRSLAHGFSIEHLLWRSEQEEEEIQRRLRALELGSSQPAPKERGDLLTNRRYVENAWNRAKPTGNFDVADRLAVYGTVIDFAAASGKADSDLTRALLDEFNVTLLPTENPFNILFVRSVHGLGLQDLDAIRRYRDELAYLSPTERALVLLTDEPNSPLYTLEPRRQVQPVGTWAYPQPLKSALQN